VVAATAAAVIALPEGTPEKESFRPGAQVVTIPHKVRMTAERRRAINELLDAFVPAAMERRSPLTALPLVTQSFRAGVSREDWARGDLPVFPYHAKGKRFHSWRVIYSFPRQISIDLLLHPTEKETLGALAITADFKKVHGRWLIDSFVPAASFAPEKKKPRILASPDFTPFAEDRGTGQLSTTWLLVPAGLFALIVLIPVALGIAHLRRSRRAWRAYQAR